MKFSRILSVLLAASLLAVAASTARAQLDPTDFTSLGTLNITSGTLNINTDTLAMTGAATFTGVALNQNGGPQIAVFDFSSISISGTATVSFTGTRAVALLSRGNATITPTLAFSPSSSSQPITLGGFQGGGVQESISAGDLENELGFGPGGGFSFSTSAGGGGHGGLGGTTTGPAGGAAGGSPYGNLFQILQGGSGGGAAVFDASSSAAQAIGGSGGGSIELVAVNSLSVSSITMSGAAGTTNAASGSAGGGAGGGVLLSSGSTMTVSGTLNVSGGAAAGNSAGGGGGGRIALAGPSYTFGTNPFTTSLSGGNGNGTSANPGFAGVISEDALLTTVTTGNTITLDGTPVTVSAGSVTQAVPTVEAYIHHDLTVNTGATITFGMDQPLTRFDSSGNNVTALTVNGTVDMNGYNEVIDTLAGTSVTSTLKIPATSTLTVGASGGTASYLGQITGAGALIKNGAGTETLGGTNTFGGLTTVNAGGILIGNNLALQNSTVNLAGGGLTFFVPSPILGALAGTTNISLTGLSSFTVGGNNSSTTYNGNITGNISTGLNKTGSGIWTLLGTNTFSGPFNAQAGVVLADSAGAISPNAAITISSGATMDFNGFNYSVTSINPLVVNGFLRLSGAGVTVASGGSATYNGTVINGFLLGTGTHTLNAGATLSAVTTSSSVTMNQTGNAIVSNFTNNGQFNNPATKVLTWINGTNASAGRLTVNGTVTASDFISTGIVTINAGGAINNSVSNIVFAGGSRTTINPSGLLSTANGTTIELNDSLLVNNGTVSGTLNVNYGSLAKGTGTYGAVNVTQGGIYAPGNSPGIVTAAAVNFDNTAVNSGAAMLQIELGGTMQGTQYDLLNVTGPLSLGGILQVSLVNNFMPSSGNTFDILDWGSLSGRFSTLELPSLTAPLGWDTSALYTTGVLAVTNTVKGDVNRDGFVTVADISALMAALADLPDYRTSKGLIDPTLFKDVADVNGDGVVDNRDIQALISQVANNNVTPSGGALPITAVPEPAAFFLAACGAVGCLLLRRRRKF